MGDVIQFKSNEMSEDEVLVGALDHLIDGLLGYSEMLSEVGDEEGVKVLIKEIVALHLYAAHTVSDEIQKKIDIFTEGKDAE